MQDRNLFLTFFTFLVLSLIIFLAHNFGILSGPASLLYKLGSSLKVSARPVNNNDLVSQNLKLSRSLVDQQKLLGENAALRDQFKSQTIPSRNLLPAKITGSPSFIPGVTEPQWLIIDKGAKDVVRVGQAVIFENNLVGRVSETGEDSSKVELITNDSFSLTAKVVADANSAHDILGVVKGQGSGELVLDNVLLSEKLNKGAMVLTKGNVNENGTGVPPELIIGKIILIEKKPSELFQKARLENPVDTAHLTTVFIVF